VGPPDQIHNWKKQLLDGAASVFQGGGSAEGASNEAQIDHLYRQIGQLKARLPHTRRHCSQQRVNIDDVNSRLVDPAVALTATGADIETRRATP
jgi:hypothetical protein